MPIERPRKGGELAPEAAKLLTPQLVQVTLERKRRRCVVPALLLAYAVNHFTASGVGGERRWQGEHRAVRAYRLLFNAAELRDGKSTSAGAEQRFEDFAHPPPR